MAVKETFTLIRPNVSVDWPTLPVSYPLEYTTTYSDDGLSVTTETIYNSLGDVDSSRNWAETKEVKDYLDSRSSVFEKQVSYVDVDTGQAVNPNEIADHLEGLI